MKIYHQMVTCMVIAVKFFLGFLFLKQQMHRMHLKVLQTAEKRREERTTSAYWYAWSPTPIWPSTVLIQHGRAQ